MTVLRNAVAGHWLVVAFLLALLGTVSAFSPLPDISTQISENPADKPNAVCMMIGFDEEEDEPIRVC